MCEYCGQRFCPSGCPNAPESEPIGQCGYCGDGILQGEKYIDTEFGVGLLHVDCIYDLDIYELLSMLGIKIKEA